MCIRDRVRIMYQIRMYHTCRCTINSTAVSLFVYSLVGGGTHDTYVPPVDAHVWRQLHLSAVARCSDSYCIFRPMVRLVCRFMLLRSTKQLTLSEECRVDRSMSHAAAVCCSCWPKNANYLIRAKRVSNCYIPKKKSVRVSVSYTHLTLPTTPYV